MNRRTALVLLSAVALLIAAGAWRWHTARVPVQGVVTIAGGDAGGLPRADADAEGFDAKALQAAVELARAPQSGGLLVTRHPGCVFLVPGGDGATGRRRAGARVVVTERLSTDEFWLPAGVYADHWTLREGMPVMTARQLLALPGVVDLAGGHGQLLLSV